ncbi:uncharacterized protein LOC100574667 isoform X1 [Acyrthosiphon pisum]|uniref:G-protein coupled receptors family 2 profile 2 domain-containing protein n=1 Tax=Acyrthosiphon pisum TaxID=7029 RepID=A0A8R1W7X3_ACYPI|nr:uncharacterized protein LOC100574667 isoform X1 [Acyrthosiphon pisum]|eukprot:XP_003242344.1 PREDICTED: uncharacterized protein LOC100574667 [Acyrthosiphon pisum]
MTTVRTSFATIVAFLVVAIGWWAADAVVCCNSSSVASGGGGVVASCQNKNRTFHTVEAIGGGTCDNDQTAVLVTKCCPPGQSYDPKVQFCRPAVVDSYVHLQRMMQRVRDESLALDGKVMVGYNYEQPLCEAADVLVDVSAMKVSMLMENNFQDHQLPGYCFDLTPSDDLVARTCHADAVVCCNNSSVASSGRDIVASCRNQHQLYHMAQALGHGMCDDNRQAVPVRKCCAPGQSYDPKVGFCRPAVVDSYVHLRRMIQRVRDESLALDGDVIVGYNYGQPPCYNNEVLVDVPTVILRLHLEVHSSVLELPPGYCFDLTPSDDLVARTCFAAPVICCNSSSVTTSGGDVVASCQNKNRTFHTVEAIGGGTCDNDQTAVLITKCCPLGQSYDPKVQFCRPAVVDGYVHLGWMMRWLTEKSLAMLFAKKVGYIYEQPLCDAADVLVDVPAVKVSMLLKQSRFLKILPPGYCFDLTPSYDLVARTCHTALVICCNSSSVASVGRDVIASCQNKNRTFHTVQAIGRGTCDDNRTAVPVWKCCPLGQSFDLSRNFCKTAGVNGDEQMRQMMQLLSKQFQTWGVGVMVAYNYEQLVCENPYELLNIHLAKYVLMKSESFSEFPKERCFDLSPDDELVGGLCRPSQYCLRNTCVHRCCKGDRMIVDGLNGPECTVNEKPFTMSAYEIDEDGRQVGRSNRTVLPYYVKFNCPHRDMLSYGFQLTEDGRLYLTYEHHIVPHTEYCVGYSQVTDSIVAFICDADFVYMVERARARSIPVFCRASYVASAVLLALTLLVYNTLPSLRNIHNYFVKCYMSHQFVSYIFAIAEMIIENKQRHTCVLFGYITLFVFLSTLCWLNVICFDIYWMIRYNFSTNRNTPTSVRTAMYHFYCWGLSSIIVCTGLFFQYSQDKSLQKLSPDIGEYGCFYYHMSGNGGLIFILIPVFVMLTANLILFLLTAIYFSRIKDELNKFRRADLKTGSFLVYKEKFVISIKLFLIMGIPYLLTVLSIILRIERTKWNIIYAASSLQGVFIFIIFVAKTHVIMELRKMFGGSMDHIESTQMNNIYGSS